MTSPRIEGSRLYKILYRDYDNDFGAGVVGISGSQGSVKTSVCLDVAEKKMRYHPDEIIFWRETFNSPMQCKRILDFPYKLFVQKGLDVEFVNTSQKRVIHPPLVFFDDIPDLYSKAETQTLNVPFFVSEQSWSWLIKYCNSNEVAAGDWQTIFLDEMEGLYEEGADNQTEEKWWTFNRDSGHIIKECRKSTTGVIGNYHDENLIDHRVRNKFMFYMYGFGAMAGKKTRVRQYAIDKCVRGEFWIAETRGRYGKVKIAQYYPPSVERWIAKKL